MVKGDPYAFKTESFADWKYRQVHGKPRRKGRFPRTLKPELSTGLGDVSGLDEVVQALGSIEERKAERLLNHLEREEGPNKPEYRMPETRPVEYDRQPWSSSVPATRVHFRLKGRMIGALNFAHLMFDIDVAGLISKSQAVCDSAVNWHKEFKNSGRQHVVYFKDIMSIYHLQCQHLNYDFQETESIWLNGELSRAGTGRGKRQFVLGALLGAGIVAASSYFFSHSALLQISAGSNQNPLTIRHLQDHETRVTTNERSIQILERTLKEAREAINQSKSDEHLTHVLIKAQAMVTAMVRWADHFLEGLQMLHSHRLSPKLIESSQIVPVLEEMRNKLAQLGLEMAVEHAEDLFRLECSHLIFKNGTVRVMIHIPAYKKGGLLLFNEYISSPIKIGSGRFFNPQPEGNFLASNSANNLFRTFTQDQLANCKSVGEIYYCKNENWFRKRYQDNCLINLYLHDTDRIREHCRFVVTNEVQTITQIDHETFNLYSEKQDEVSRSCSAHSSRQDKISFKGMIELKAHPSCTLESSAFVLEGSADIFIEPRVVRYQELDILSSEDLKMLEDNFHLLPPGALDLVGSTKGLKIKDIKGEFERQHFKTVLTIGMFSGLLVLGILILCCCCCFKLKLFPRIWKCLKPKKKQRTSGSVSMSRYASEDTLGQPSPSIPRSRSRASSRRSVRRGSPTEFVDEMEMNTYRTNREATREDREEESSLLSPIRKMVALK